MRPAVFYGKARHQLGTETESVRIAIRSHYGRSARFLASLTVAAAPVCLKVYIFDLPGSARIYAWSSPVTGKVIVMQHGAQVMSPKEAVAHPHARELGT